VIYFLVLIGYFSVVASPTNAQSAANPRQIAPKLAPGETIKGSEHPEYFSRRIAFQTLLELLSIQPDDAVHSQRRARMLAVKRIGLADQDTAALEQIVERYRVEELDRKTQAASLVLHGSNSAAFSDLNKSHFGALRDAVSLINTNVSIDGRQKLNIFLDDMISHSELRGTNQTKASGGTQ
jgi:hypothetical protein